MGRGASTNSIPEIENARFLFVIGSNTTEAHPVLALRMKKAVRNGATLVVADPRRIWLTKIAKRHLQLRPGSDVWLINAMMNVILEEGLQNEEYIREFTDDFEALREVVSRYTPEEAEQVTGVPAEDIRATAREYATERHAAIFYTLGITEHACGVDNIWSLSNLVLMTGHLGYESTGLNALRGQNNVQGLNDSGANPPTSTATRPVDDPEIRKKFSEAWGVEVPETPGYRLDQIMAACHDNRIQALYLIGENPMQTEPNAHHVEEGIAGLEFIVSQDIFLNDMTMKYADVVFPASSFAEKDGTFTNTERRINRVRAAVPCPGNARVDRDIVIDLARALGANWPDYPDAESVWNEMADLAPAWYGIRYDRLEEQGMQWPAPELGHPGSPYLHAPRPARAGRTREVLPRRVSAADRATRLGVPAHPQHGPHALPLQLGDDDDARDRASPTSRRSRSSRSRPRTRRTSGWPRATGRGSSSRRGSLEARVAISDRVYPGLVWMALHFEGAKVNWLTHDVGDPLIGTPEYKISRGAGGARSRCLMADSLRVRARSTRPSRAASGRPYTVRRGGVRVDAALAARRERA